MSNREHATKLNEQASLSEPAEPKGKPERPRLRGLFEAALLFISVIAVTYAITGDTKLNGINPHPFWIAVILISMHYGTYHGLAAALMAVLLNFAIDWPIQGVHEDYFVYFGRIWAEPILWVTASLLLGELRMQHLAELKALRDRSREAEHQRRVIAAFSADQLTENRRLEHQLAVGAREFMREHLQQLAQFEASNLDELEQRAGALMREVFPRAKLSLWRLGKMHLDIQGAPESLRKSLHSVLIKQRRLLNGFDEADASLLKGRARLAAPVFLPNGEPVGAFAVTDLEALSLDVTDPLYLSLLARQAGAALGESGFAGHSPRQANTDRASLPSSNSSLDGELEAS